MVLVKELTNETTIMWIGIAVAIIGVLLVALMCLLGKKKPAPITDDVYQSKVNRRKEIDKQIKALATIAITTKDTLDKLRDEQDELDKWLEAYKLVNRK